MKRTIYVTDAHIKAGRKCEPGLCPISLAIRQTIDYPAVWVGALNVKIGHRLHDLPVAAQDFIEEFDSGSRVDPFSFELEMR